MSSRCFIFLPSGSRVGPRSADRRRPRSTVISPKPGGASRRRHETSFSVAGQWRAQEGGRSADDGVLFVGRLQTPPQVAPHSRATALVMALLGPMVVVAENSAADLIDVLGKAGAFPIVETRWADAPAAIGEIQPVALAIADPQGAPSPQHVGAVIQWIE